MSARRDNDDMRKDLYSKALQAGEMTKMQMHHASIQEKQHEEMDHAFSPATAYNGRPYCTTCDEHGGENPYAEGDYKGDGPTRH